ncbi:RNA-binding protein [Desertifilum sp. FACHB-1129]|uniref:RNA-binding protein n=2 Tax=Cyanophyceae TaxID=3028117 RepID=A0A1E5QJW1_9CYAN|nr:MULTISPECIES: RNA-binding protein [Cyanophyceae]MCD8486891.1 RNA-binding protein [Desertifilum sp.]MDA0210954.1 RNA-binding protein [Cyanobacteria bacterium FC1]MDK3159039.1 RNA-binding protein [Kamptonema cortianum]MBD2313443.1 RNA-binding protein [Desertifilum sp. FACHB-1129]MBD2322313.1 RNA-binding protein [Desertifilum sp. FACHB-866]
MSIRLYVGNLPKEIDRQELAAVFADAGDSISTKVITDRKTGKCRGFGFVTVKTDEQADEIIEKYNGYVFKDNALKIEKALPRAKGKSDEEAPVASSAGSSATASSSGRRKNNNNKSRRSPSTSTESSNSVQPDPRWAQELEKLKEMLAAQATNS